MHTTCGVFGTYVLVNPAEKRSKMRRAEFRAASSPNLSESSMAGWAPVLGFASPLELRPKPLGGFAAIMLLGLPLHPRPLWGSAPNPVGPPPQSNPVQEGSGGGSPQRGLGRSPSGVWGGAPARVWGSSPQLHSFAEAAGVWGRSPQLHSCGEAGQGLGAEPPGTA